VLEFPLACGITAGTPVRIRGVPVGSVLTVNPSLEKVEVLVEVRCAALLTLSAADATPFMISIVHCMLPPPRIRCLAEKVARAAPTLP
jgi:hypothetical protein